jgi:hypothetical protein
MSMRCSAEAGAYATPNQPIQTGKLQATCWHDSAKSGILVGSSRAVNVLTCSPASPFKNSRSDHQCHCISLHITALLLQENANLRDSNVRNVRNVHDQVGRLHIKREPVSL